MREMEPLIITDRIAPIVHGITSWDNFSGDYQFFADDKCTMLWGYPCFHGNALEINRIETDIIDFKTRELCKTLKT